MEITHRRSKFEIKMFALIGSFTPHDACVTACATSNGRAHLELREKREQNICVFRLEMIAHRVNGCLTKGIYRVRSMSTIAFWFTFGFQSTNRRRRRRHEKGSLRRAQSAIRTKSNQILFEMEARSEKCELVQHIASKSNPFAWDDELIRFCLRQNVRAANMQNGRWIKGEREKSAERESDAEVKEKSVEFSLHFR